MADMAVPALSSTPPILEPAKKKPVQTITEAENKHQFESMLREDKATSDKKVAEHTGSALKNVFNDPEKMLKLWLLNETRPNPFCEEQKDPMESFGKFIQSMLMQNQTSTLGELKETMEKNSKYAALIMVDKVVEIESDKLGIASGRKIIHNFTVPENIQGYGVTIENSVGEVIYKKFAYDVNPGINQFVWEGVDQEDKAVPVGDYKISVSLQRKTKNEEGMPKFEHVEFANDLSGKPINEKVETLSTMDRNVQFSYELPTGVEKLKYASVWIFDSKGTKVHKAEVEARSVKTQTFSWNCLDDDGKRVDEGVYSIKVNLLDEKREILEPDKDPIIRVTGKVQGIEVHEGGEPNLITSRIKAPLSSVKRILNEEQL